MFIKNYNEIHDELIEMLKDFVKQSADFQIDVYLYVDEDDIAKLREFVNPGGNSWLNDDHIKIYSVKPPYDDLKKEYRFDSDEDIDADWGGFFDDLADYIFECNEIE